MPLSSVLRSRSFQSLIGIVVSLVLVAWVVLHVEWQGVSQQLSQFRWWALFPVLGSLLLHFFIRSLRWRYLLPEGEKISFKRLFDSLMVGNFATFILPLRAGEFIRPFLLSRWTGKSFSTCFVSVVVERFFDLSVVLVSFAIVVRFVPAIPDWAHQGAAFLTIIAAIILLVMVIGSYAPAMVLIPARTVFRFLPAGLANGLDKFLTDFLTGAAVLKRPKNLILAILYSMMVWGSCFLFFHCFFYLLGEPPAFTASVSVAVIVALAVAAPSAPGFIGVYQTACIAGFQLFGMSSEYAVAYSLVSHLIQYVLFVAYGMYVLTRENISLKELSSQRAV